MAQEAGSLRAGAHRFSIWSGPILVYWGTFVVDTGQETKGKEEGGRERL